MYHVLVAVDEAEDRSERQAEAVADLPDAPESVRATVFHCFTDNPSGASASQITGVRRARERLEEAGVEVSLHEDSGDPADGVLDTAEEMDVDLVCMGGRKHTPTGKALFGSVTQAVILNADRPVMVPGHE
ncbi:universal stress protein [Halostella litorea]|uniref:universal stress protein n=1 Tax=Halostella litorea TaxID=2528831 RepID=UPI001091DC48|nr:universal stress protein [Halostella litorea]